MMYDEPSLPPQYPLGHFLAPPRKEDRWRCDCWKTDDLNRHCIGWCGPDCEGRPLHGRHARGEDRR